MLVFLDIDGVLNQLQPNFYLDKNCIKALGKITDKVVLISTWKYGWCRDFKRCTPQVQDLITLLREVGVEIVGHTRDLDKRDKECELYMKEHNLTEKYIILDDDIKLYSDKSKLYVVDSKTGFLGLSKKKWRL